MTLMTLTPTLNRRWSAPLLLAASLAASAAQADTGNLIGNGDFEAGLSGWLRSGGVALSSSAHDGLWAASLLDSGSGAELTWTLGTAVAVSQVSVLSLWLQSDAGALNQVLLGYADGSVGTALIEDFGNSDWTAYSLLGELAAGKQLVSITVQGNTGGLTLLDGGRLSTVSAVPEPGSWALALLGGAVLLQCGRRRAKAAG